MQIIDMNHSGDTRHDFDMSKDVEVAKAMEKFNALISSGKLASVPDPDGHSGRLIRQFDPEAKTIIFRNQNIGG